MMEKRWIWIAMLMIGLVAFAGCSDDDDDPITPASATFEDLYADLDDYFLGGGAWYITAANLNTAIVTAENDGDPAPYTIIDVRSATAWGDGHIKGALNIGIADIPAALADGTIPTDKPMVVTCYTGQSAGWATGYLNSMGYTCQSLKFGMSSWRADLDGSWNTAITGNTLDTFETDNNNGDLVTNDFPSLDDFDTDARLEWAMEDGFKGIAYTDLETRQDGGEEFFIMNYWAEGDYDGTGGRTPGHIPGAFCFEPITSLDMDGIANIPADATVVVYCWTGQTSSQITMFLRMLGYDAWSLKFGANNLFYDELTGTAPVWVDNTMDYPIYDENEDLIETS